MKYTPATQVAMTVTALLVTLGCTSALASGNASTGSNATHFDGFTLGVDLDADVMNAHHINSEKTTYKFQDATTSSHHNGNGAMGFLNLGATGIYRAAINDSWLLGGGVKLQLTDSKLGSGKNNQRLTSSQTWFVTPAYALSKHTLLFGKIGVTNRKHAGGAVPLYSSLNLRGKYYAAGVQYAFTPKVHLTVEYALTDYEKLVENTKEDSVYASKTSDTELKLDSGTLSVGMAYRF